MSYYSHVTNSIMNINFSVANFLLTASEKYSRGEKKRQSKNS
jgi:hypothetical protein